MSKILYVLDNNKSSNYEYDIDEDTIIYHYSINSSSKVNINLLLLTTRDANNFYLVKNKFQRLHLWF